MFYIETLNVFVLSIIADIIMPLNTFPKKKKGREEGWGRSHLLVFPSRRSECSDDYVREINKSVFASISNCLSNL